VSASSQTESIGVKGFFSSLLEAVLLDFMARQPAPALAAAVQAAQCNFRGNQNASDPLTWSLFNLIKAAQQITGRGNLEPPQALREWRNTIHPAVTLRQYRTDVEMGPEVRAASALHEIVMRDLP
jgi:hypothetical protein